MLAGSYHPSPPDWADHLHPIATPSYHRKGFKLGGSTYIDQLSYGYQSTNASNKLNAIVDAANDTTAKLGDFQYNPATKQSTDYSYDGNGNQLKDNNRKIDAITYNFLNLAQQMHVNGKGNVQYVFDASGGRLQKITVDSPANKKTITTYVAGFVYQSYSTLTGSGTDTLQMLSHEEGRIRWAYHKYTTGTSAYKYEYDFFLRDNQGNTRMVLTQQKDTAKYLASMEAAYRSTETALFNNIASSSYARNLISGYPTDGTTSPNDSVSHLNGNGQKTGPSLLLKVMSGDTVDIGVHSFYTSQTGTGTSASITDVLNSLASGISNMTAGAKGTVSQLTNPSGALYNALNYFITNSDPNPSGKPKAYLNWILFDEQLNPVSSYPQTNAIPVGNYTAGTLGTPGQTGIPMTRNGYLYIWVSNETQSWDVYFDNLSVVHHTGPLLEENHYYPFGLAMAAISAKALKTNYTENKLRYNGGSEMQNKEFSDGSGLEMYETSFRGYDAQIGRFGQVDPMAGSDFDYSVYAYGANNPVTFSDPTGAIRFYYAAPVFYGDLSGGISKGASGGGGGGPEESWSSGLSSNSSSNSNTSTATTICWDDINAAMGTLETYKNGGAWYAHTGQFDAYTSEDNAIIAGANLKASYESGAAAFNSFQTAIQNYNAATGENLDPIALAPVTDVGHHKNGGWVTTNGADLQNQLLANGALGVEENNGLRNAGIITESLNLSLETTNEFVIGAQKLANKLSGASSEILSAGKLGKIGGVGFGLLNMAFTFGDAQRNGSWENHHTADMLISGGELLLGLFESTSPIGWAFAGGMFIGNLISEHYTGKTITENLFDKR